MTWHTAGPLAGCLWLCSLATSGCTALPPAGMTDPQQTPDASPDAEPTRPTSEAGQPDASPRRASDASAPSDASPSADASAADAAMKPVILPMEPPFMPHEAVRQPQGQSLVSSGVSCSSAHYSAVRTVGQSPVSGYPVRRSQNYVLVGGVIGVTHAFR